MFPRTVLCFNDRASLFAFRFGSQIDLALIRPLGLNICVSLLRMMLIVLLVFAFFVSGDSWPLDRRGEDYQGRFVQVQQAGGIAASGRCLFRSLEVNERVGTVSILCPYYSARFDFTDLLENVDQISFSFGAEALHVHRACCIERLVHKSPIDLRSHNRG